jgi:multiple sugar transport system ATP-binding protein
VNLFVASFIGSPAMNVVEARLDGDELEFGGLRIPLGRSNRPAVRDDRVILGIRPESFQDAAFADGSLPQIDVQVAVLEELGSDSYVVFPVAAPPVRVEEIKRAQLIADVGTTFTARVSPETAARPTERLRLAVNPDRFHFFDRETGTSLAPAPVSGARAYVPATPAEL